MDDDELTATPRRGAVMSVIICEEPYECRDKNVNRWYCHADDAGVCPVRRCGGPGLKSTVSESV